LDFYIPLSKLCIEVHGEQHYKFIPFYHGNIMSFLKAQKKDREKKEWCDNNNIRYIELPYNENQEQWINRINHEQ
jgi:predicted adenine nucleotide alpha hydrolase (AANH) superfamily ATPase